MKNNHHSPRRLTALLLVIAVMLSLIPSAFAAQENSYMNAVDYMFAGLEKRKPDCFAVKQYKKYKLASGDVCSK